MGENVRGIKKEVVRRLGREIPSYIFVPWSGVVALHSVHGDAAIGELVVRLRKDISIVESSDGRMS